MPNRLKIIIALIVGIGQSLTLASGSGLVPGWPVLVAYIQVDDLTALIIFHSRLLFQRPPHLVKRRRLRRRRPPPPRPLPKPAEEEEEAELPPGGGPKSPHELLDKGACVALFEAVRWAEGVVCPRCGSRAVQRVPRRMQAGLQCYRCLSCQVRNGVIIFHAATGTPFEHSHLSPTQWMMALLSFARGDSALEMADQIGVSPRMGERWLRILQVVIYQQRPTSPLKGPVEADEIYVISGHKGCPNGQSPPRPPRRGAEVQRARYYLLGQTPDRNPGEEGWVHPAEGVQRP